MNRSYTIIFILIIGALQLQCGQQRFDDEAFENAYRGAYEAYRQDMAKANKNAKEAVKVAVQLNDPALQAKAYYMLGLTFRHLRQFPQSYDAFLTSQEDFQLVGDEAYEQKTNYQLAILLMEAGDYLKAISMMKEVEVYFENISDYEELGKIYLALGRLYSAVNEPLQAKRYLRKAEDSEELASQSMYYVQMHLGEVFRKQQQLDSALHYYELSLHTAQQVNSVELLAHAQSQLAETYHKQKKPEASLAAAQQALTTIQGASHLAYLETHYRYNLAQAHLALGQEAAALAVLQPLPSLKSTLSQDFTYYQKGLNLLQRLSQLQGNIQAASHYNELLDEALGLPVKGPEQQAILRAALNEIALAHQGQAMEAHISAQSRVQWLLTACAVVVLILGLSFWRYHHRQQRRNRETERRLAELEAYRQQSGRLRQEALGFFHTSRHLHDSQKGPLS